MENDSVITKNLLEEKDKEIARLNVLVKNSIKNYHYALQQASDLKAAQEKTQSTLENIVANMPGHVYWKDINGLYLGCNNRQARSLGFEYSHEIVSKTDFDLPWGENKAEIFRINDLRIMDSGKTEIIEEQSQVDGQNAVVLSHKSPLRNKQGEITGVLGISIDITDLKMTEEALTIAKENAEAANRAKIEFIANMSHDIRTPLSGVIGMSQLLEERLVEPEHKQFAVWIKQSGEQLLSLLNSILDLVSVENVSEHDIRNDPFNLRQCIKDIVQLELPATLLKKIGLNIEIDERAPQHIVTDQAKLHRVLLNLLGNAIKFTQSGYITIDVKYVDFNGDQAYLQFQVIDTGIGISLEHQEQVFDRFFRASASYDGIYSGSGVGLNIAQSYVKLLGGELNFTSQPGMGTTFYFDLPVAVVEMDDPEIDFERSDLLSNRFNYVNLDNALHLLLVEDNVVALRMVELIADQAGCCYTSAVNGEDALILAKSIDFDLIVTDIGLPGMSGYDLTRHIREWETEQHKPVIPIVGLTAHAYAKNQCIESGMNDVFCKPLNLPILESILSQHIEGSLADCKLNKHRHDLPDSDSQLFELDHFAVLDIDHAADRIGNKTVLLELLHLMAAQEIPYDEHCLHDAYQAGNWPAIEKLVHKMKGGAVYCGTFKMQYACQYLERYHKAGHTELLDSLYQQLLRVLEETKHIILHTTQIN